MTLEDLYLVRDLYDNLDKELDEKAAIIKQVYLSEWVNHYYLEKFEITNGYIEMTFEGYNASDFDIAISFEDVVKSNEQFKADLEKRKEREDEEKRIRAEKRKLEEKKMLEEAQEQRDQAEYQRLMEKYAT
jgi:hypothetical protein